MINMLHLTKAIACICVAALLGGQALAQKLSRTERERIMVEQDVKAAGNSGDTSFIPYRNDVVRERKHDHHDWDDAQMALAKLGDRKQQQNIVCVFYQGTKYESEIAATRQLPYAGGWFAIQMYRAMLINEKIMSHWFRADPRDPGDRVMVSPQTRALQILPTLIPALPPAAAQRPVKQTIALWNEYINAHQAELSRLAPTGEGVDFSEITCSGKSDQKKNVLRGMVFDHTGSVVPDVNVEIRALPSGASTPSSRTGPPALTLRTGREGDFSAELAADSYQVCVSRFPKSCQTVEIQSTKPPEYLRLKIDPSDLQRESIGDRIRAIAGPGAKNCGHVLGQDDPSRATKCALRAVKQRKAFYVSYDEMGFEGWTAAMAGDSSGNVYSVNSDPMAYELEVTACSKPVRVRATKSGVTRRGVLTCFAEGRWLAQ